MTANWRLMGLRATTCILAAWTFGSHAAAQTTPPKTAAASVLCKDCPDLIVNVDDSFAFDPNNPPSCETDKPLTGGYVAVKNIGDGVADIAGSRSAQTASVLGFSPGPTSLVHIYNPYNLHMRATNAAQGLSGPDRFQFTASKLDPFDQKGFKFRFAEGVQKRFRNFGPPDLASGTRQNLSSRDEIRLIQKALNDDKILELDPKIEVDGAYGDSTRRAIVEYQKAIGAEPTGLLTRRQRDKLFKVAFNNLGAQTRVCVDIYAVVDPEDRIPESNEANNIAAWKVEIDCRPNAAGDDEEAEVTVTSSYDPGYSACNVPF